MFIGLKKSWSTVRVDGGVLNCFELSVESETESVHAYARTRTLSRVRPLLTSFCYLFVTDRSEKVDLKNFTSLIIIKELRGYLPCIVHGKIYVSVLQ